MSGQPAAARVIADIEAWWGEGLSEGLIDRITSAPFDHLIAFHEEGNDLQDLYESGHLPPLAAGELRPVWGEALEPTSFNYRTAAKLLLYVDSVVEDSHRLEPFNVVEIEDARRDHVFVRRSIREDLEWLFYHRPLIDDGSILFTAKFRGLSHFGFWDSFTGAFNGGRIARHGARRSRSCSDCQSGTRSEHTAVDEGYGSFSGA